ncbi:tumor necrosis factor (ligand) superfamily, member 10 like 3 isoform X2 [Brachyhypopomus gauderio]|uniref:tumor necrosis factor (ligand) superfamily, member 10 like 3 isoform X2 n=1 Tax=Brachyhypopomus gauderio TaxID=698409 RepID=UPI0040418731
MNMDVATAAPSFEHEEQSFDRNALASEANSNYLRSVNSESSSFIMVQPKGRMEAPSKLWMIMIVIVMIILQVASTAGLLVYLNISMSQVTENIISQHAFQERQSTGQPHTKFLTGGNPRPSAHLTLRDSGPQGPTSLTPQLDLHQSCRHLVRSWGNQSFGSHLHNMTVSNGRLRIPQTGRYYLYAQVYFRYITLSSSSQQSSSESHQVVQCVYKKTAYARPIQLLKGVGTKCWAPDSENALHSVYQGGLFELRAGDEIFVSVSSPVAVHAEDSSSYFGAFHFDL